MLSIFHKRVGHLYVFFGEMFIYQIKTVLTEFGSAWKLVYPFPNMSLGK